MFKLVTFERTKRDVPITWLNSPDQYNAYIKGVKPETQVCLELLTWRGARPGTVPFTPKVPFNARGRLGTLAYLKLLVEAKIPDDLDKKPITDLRLHELVEYIQSLPDGQFIPSKRPQVISLEGDHKKKLNIVYIEELYDNAILSPYDIFRFIRFQVGPKPRALWPGTTLYTTPEWEEQLKIDMKKETERMKARLGSEPGSSKGTSIASIFD